jgi:hypothetical protein
MTEMCVVGIRIPTVKRKQVGAPTVHSAVILESFQLLSFVPGQSDHVRS